MGWCVRLHSLCITVTFPKHYRRTTTRTWLFSSVHDFLSNSGGDCKGTDPVFEKCPPGWRGDGVCNEECNNEENSYA